MRGEMDKENKNEQLVNVALQFSLFMTDNEIDIEVDLPHEVVVTKCVESLARKNYSIEVERME